MIQFTPVQLAQLERKNITKETILKQIERFQTGFPMVKMNRAAVVNDGILKFSDQEILSLQQHFDEKSSELALLKFVPASGAATRMFKFLHEFIRDYDPSEDSINSFINKNKARELFTFFIALEKFPFYDAVMESLKETYPDWHAKADREKKLLFVKQMLQDNGLNYGHMPKGLVPFHKYKDHSATAFEEHLFEASVYAATNNKARLHFTIAEDFKDHFTAEFNRIEQIVEHKTGTEFDIEFSHQKTSTDTIAVDKNNNPVITENGELFFRPSGHGALLMNLNEINADIIFIKNIDNVTVSSLEQEVGAYKKTLAGLLLNLQQQCFDYLELIDDKKVDAALQLEIEEFLTGQLCAVLPSDYKKYAREFQLEYLYNRLNRPLRVCGMVKNEGEPGGGPFWVYNQKGELSIEIIEGAQVDTSNKKQVAIAKTSTHFNPVDLVCAVRDYKGNKFDLLEFCDEQTGFITHKSRLGRSIKAQELPGLWNGGMAYWNSVFVEVPLITFNPVKTVNDLLKPAHQN
ncbi:MAG: DUF4301 family protein [Nonlabens sp.]|uniref:DUF4301 family protein n=1 Tax=Nonlabens sp. TaxID=1888209 RepID=UPI003EF4BD78